MRGNSERSEGRLQNGTVALVEPFRRNAYFAGVGAPSGEARLKHAHAVGHRLVRGSGGLGVHGLAVFGAAQVGESGARDQDAFGGARNIDGSQQMPVALLAVDFVVREGLARGQLMDPFAQWCAVANAL